MKYPFSAYNNHIQRWLMHLVSLIIGAACQKNIPSIEPDPFTTQAITKDIGLKIVDKPEPLVPDLTKQSDALQTKQSDALQTKQSDALQTKQSNYINNALYHLAILENSLMATRQQFSVVTACTLPTTLEAIRANTRAIATNVELYIGPAIHELFSPLLQQAVPTKENVTGALIGLSIIIEKTIQECYNRLASLSLDTSEIKTNAPPRAK